MRNTLLAIAAVLTFAGTSLYVIMGEVDKLPSIPVLSAE